MESMPVFLLPPHRILSIQRHASHLRCQSCSIHRGRREPGRGASGRSAADRWRTTIVLVALARTGRHRRSVLLVGLLSDGRPELRRRWLCGPVGIVWIKLLALPEGMIHGVFTAHGRVLRRSCVLDGEMR